MARVKEYIVTGFAADAAGVAGSQAPTANTPLTLTANPVVLNPPREVTLTSAGDLSGVSFLISGLDRWGNTIRELMVGPNANTVRSRKVFAQVNSIVPTASSATTLTAGWPARTVTPWVACGRRFGFEQLPICAVSALIVAGAADGDVEVSYDSNFAPATANYPAIGADTGPDGKGEGLRVDETLAVTPGTPLDAQGTFCRFVLTTGAGTTMRARFAQPGP